MITTQASKDYRNLMEKVNQDMDFWSKQVQKVTGKDKDIVLCEVQSIYLDNLRKADDLQALAKENIANLMMKQKVSTELKRAMYQNQLKKAEQQGDEEAVNQVNQDILKHLVNTDADYKIFKAVNEGLKTMKSLEPRKVAPGSHSGDDKMVFDIEDGVYTEE